MKISHGSCLSGMGGREDKEGKEMGPPGYFVQGPQGSCYSVAVATTSWKLTVQRHRRI